jgi:hypothetical protein
LVKVLWCEDLAICLENQSAHVCPSLAESATGKAGDNLESMCSPWLDRFREGGQPQNPCDLIPGRPVVLADLCLDHHLWRVFIRDDEIGGLVKGGQLLRSAV